MTPNVDNIVSLYGELTEEEKISLYLQLQSKDMREHYDPSNVSFRIQAKNVFGKFLVDKVIRSYNERQARSELLKTLNSNRYRPYQTVTEHMDSNELLYNNNLGYIELIVNKEI